ncbi:hypothetical protein PbDSM24746_05550 [Paenibacillus macerans]|nr:hypothetical protein [Paenibacillus macerans]GBK60551.1 hypothetical protein PbDSM24746_05550 [Paenibacillus macerans]GBK66851.1 hypothetical protein PbJCM17693_05590 [Paenibacillus macerans]
MITGIILIVLTLFRVPSAIISGRNEAKIIAGGGGGNTGKPTASC